MDRELSSARPALAQLALLYCVYVLAGRVAQGLALIPGISIVFWPPAGILAATLVLSRPTSWGWWIGVGGLAELTCNALWFKNPLPYALVYFAGNAGEALLAARLMRRDGAKPFRLESLPEAMALVTAAGAAPVVSATVIAVTDALLGKHTFTTAWPLVWLGDASGLLVSAPLTIIAVQAWREREQISAQQRLEAAALASILLGAITLAFWNHLPTAYLTIPVTVWAAVRFQMRGAAVAVGLVTISTAAFTANGIGEFTGPPEQRREKIIMLQSFLGVSALSAMVVGVIAQLHKRIQQSEARFRGVFELAGTGIAVASAEGVILQCNPAFCAMLGYTESELVGLAFRDLAHPEDAGANSDLVRRLQAGEIPSFEIENRYVGKDGRVICALERVTLLSGEEGGAARCLVMATDVTAHRAAENAVRDADRRKTEFLATLAHELRNPLAPMKSAAQLIRMKGAALPALAKNLDVLDRQIQAMVRLIDDLMDLARINHGKIHIERERVELANVVQRAVEASQTLIDAKSHRLTVALPPHPVVLDADPTRLTQVLSNLLNNAAKYTEPGGNIEVTAEVHEPEVTISVLDSGIGITPEKLPTVFGLFSQVEGSMVRSQGGLGIGLYVVKRLVELQGGRVEVHSEGPGRGSEFRVRLPLAPAKTTHEPEAARTVPTE